MKKHLPYLLSIGALAGSLTLSCKSATTPHREPGANAQTCMEKVIAEDSHYGDIRNHDCETVSLSEAISNYVAAIDNYNFQDCPAAFRKAFKKHQKSWSDILEVTRHYPELRGEMHDLFKILETGAHAEAHKALVANIFSTWAEVEQAMN